MKAKRKDWKREKKDDLAKMEILKRLKANGYNYYATSKDTGIPRTTLMRWAENEGKIAVSVSEFNVEVLNRNLEKENTAKMTDKAERLRLHNIIKAQEAIAERLEKQSDTIPVKELIQLAQLSGVAVPQQTNNYTQNNIFLQWQEKINKIRRR